MQGWLKCDLALNYNPGCAEVAVSDATKRRWPVRGVHSYLPLTYDGGQGSRGQSGYLMSFFGVT